MKASNRALISTTVLLALAGAAVAAAWFGVAKKDEAVQAKKASDEKLYAFEPAKVKAVTVEAKGETTGLARAGEGWRVESPVQADAERSAADALVDKVAQLRRKAAIAASPDAEALGRYGLSKPRAKVTLTLDDGKVETLALGDENPFDGTAFIRTTGGAVELVAGDVKWSVERGTLDLREKRLLPFEDKDLKRVEVTAPRLSYQLARDGDTWRLESPTRERADDATVSRVLAAIRGLRATAFLPASQGGRGDGLDRPRWKVKLIQTSGERTLAIGEAKGAPPAKEAPGLGSLRARLEGGRELAALADGATRDLEQDLFALRDKTVLRFDREKVAALRFTVGGSSFVARKEPPAGTRVASLVWTLSSLKAKAFADETGRKLAEHGLDQPAREVALLDPEGKELDRLSLSAARGGKTFARSASSPRIVEVDAATLVTLPSSAQDLEDKPEAKQEAKAGAK